MKNPDSLDKTKVEKTSDHTFTVHAADGSKFECNSTDKLSYMKNETVMPYDKVFGGIGKKKELICSSCQKVVLKLTGIFDKDLKKNIYYCDPCRIKINKK